MYTRGKHQRRGLLVGDNTMWTTQGEDFQARMKSGVPRYDGALRKAVKTGLNITLPETVGSCLLLTFLWMGDVQPCSVRARFGMMEAWSSPDTFDAQIHMKYKASSTDYYKMSALVEDYLAPDPSGRLQVTFGADYLPTVFPIPRDLLVVMREAEMLTGDQYNCVYAVVFPDGNSALPWHSDEKGVAPGSSIASLMFFKNPGDVRAVEFNCRTIKKPKKRKTQPTKKIKKKRKAAAQDKMMYMPPTRSSRETRSARERERWTRNRLDADPDDGSDSDQPPTPSSRAAREWARRSRKVH